jgi:hypothetical protein
MARDGWSRGRDLSTRKIGMTSGVGGNNALRIGMLKYSIPRRAGCSACASGRRFCSPKWGLHFSPASMAGFPNHPRHLDRGRRADLVACLQRGAQGESVFHGGTETPGEPVPVYRRLPFPMLRAARRGIPASNGLTTRVGVTKVACCSGQRGPAEEVFLQKKSYPHSQPTDDAEPGTHFR